MKQGFRFVHFTVCHLSILKLYTRQSQKATRNKTGRFPQEDATAEKTAENFFYKFL